jgi:hypothetical protein
MSSDLDRAIAGDLWVVQETEDLQKSFNKMVGGLVNDQEDEFDFKNYFKMSGRSGPRTSMGMIRAHGSRI